MKKENQEEVKAFGAFNDYDDQTAKPFKAFNNPPFGSIEQNKRRSEGVSLELMLEKMEKDYNEFKTEFPDMLKDYVLSNIDPVWPTFGTYGSMFTTPELAPKPEKPIRQRNFGGSGDLTTIISLELLSMYSKMEAMELLFTVNEVKDETLTKRLNDLKTDCKTFIKPILESFRIMPNHFKEMISRL